MLEMPESIRDILTLILSVLGSIWLTRYRVEMLEQQQKATETKIQEIKDRLHLIEIRDAERRGRETK